ncbi:MAG: uroporphyrinogen decarboxylase family protein [Opitutaceae bacterium]|nr:uroporphyrinogen decarboxylase family protein [Opitutaceae bacterium]
MTSRERFLTALAGGIPDRVPFGDFLFSRNLLKKVLNHTPQLYEADKQVELAGRLGLDCMWIPINGYCGTEEEVHAEGEKYQDEWGVTYVKNGWPIMAQIDTPIKNRADWERYTMPSPAAPHRLRMLADGTKANTHDLAILFGILGPFTMMYWYLMDLETLSLMTYDDPPLVHEMCDAFIQWNLASAQRAVDRGGVDAFIVADDWGGTHALLMSPSHLRKFFVPPFRKLVQGLKSLGKPVIMHNDGRIVDLLDDLVDTGIDGYHPVERAAGMDLSYVKKRYASRLCPIGNVDNKGTMSTATPAGVEAEVKECLAIGMPGGRYILSTDHSIHDGMPHENVMAYIAAGRKHGVYR